MYGFRKLTEPEKQAIDIFIENCKIVDINKQIKSEVINLRQLHTIKLPDAIILGSAVYLDIPLISSDSAFKKFEAKINYLHYTLNI